MFVPVLSALRTTNLYCSIILTDMVVVGFVMENITHFNINLDSEIVEIGFLCLARFSNTEM